MIPLALEIVNKTINILNYNLSCIKLSSISHIYTYIHTQKTLHIYKNMYVSLNVLEALIILREKVILSFVSNFQRKDTF